MGLSFSADDVCQSAIDFSAVLPVVWMEEESLSSCKESAVAFRAMDVFIGNIQVVQVASA